MTLAPAHIPDPRLTFVERVSDTLRQAGVRHVLLHETPGESVVSMPDLHQP